MSSLSSWLQTHHPTLTIPGPWDPTLMERFAVGSLGACSVPPPPSLLPPLPPPLPQPTTPSPPPPPPPEDDEGEDEDEDKNEVEAGNEADDEASGSDSDTGSEMSLSSVEGAPIIQSGDNDTESLEQTPRSPVISSPKELTASDLEFFDS